MMLSVGPFAARAFVRPSRSRLFCAVEQDGAECYKVGTRVRVTKSIIVYHVPKRKEGFDIKGMQGAVVSNVRFAEKMELSPNYPWKVQFEENTGGKRPLKYFVHLDEQEIEPVE